MCCTANKLGPLIVGRCIQGVGGGGIIALSLVIMTDIVPLRQRPKFYGIIQAAWALGTVIGPLIGGLFAQHSTWRWVFYINFPFCGFGLVIVPLVVRLRIEKSSFASKVARVDWIGGFLFIASLTSFLVAISWGGAQYAWSSWRTLLPLILGAIGVVASLVWERFAREPFLRHTLFGSWSAIIAYLSAAFQGLLVCHPPLYTIHPTVPPWDLQQLTINLALRWPLLPPPLLPIRQTRNPHPCWRRHVPHRRRPRSRLHHHRWPDHPEWQISRHPVGRARHRRPRQRSNHYVGPPNIDGGVGGPNGDCRHCAGDRAERLEFLDASDGGNERRSVQCGNVHVRKEFGDDDWCCCWRVGVSEPDET